MKDIIKINGVKYQRIKEEKRKKVVTKESTYNKEWLKRRKELDKEGVSKNHFCWKDSPCDLLEHNVLDMGV